MKNKAIQIGAIFAALSVVLGAFGAHGLKKIITDPALLASWDTAATYQLFHAIGMVVVGALSTQVDNKMLRWTLNFFIIGTILFSGSIYTLVLLKGTQGISLGPAALITPLGGICFIIGWISLFLAFKKK